MEDKHVIGSTFSETYLYPYFPYYPQDQKFLDAPDYRAIVDDLLSICHDQELIYSYDWKTEGVNEVLYIIFMDGDTMRLSDMQGMLVLQGILKGYKKLRETELGIRSHYEKPKKLVKRPVAGFSLDFKEPEEPKPKPPKPKKRKKKEAGTGFAKELVDDMVRKSDEDESWMDDIL